MDEISEEEERTVPGIPGYFLNISLSRCFGILLLSFIGAMVFLVVAELSGLELSDADLIHLTGILLFLPVLYYLLARIRSDHGLRGPLIGKPGRPVRWTLAWIFLPLLILSLGMGWLWDLFLHQIMPGYLEGKYAMMEQTPFMDKEGSFLNTAITFAGAVVMAPLVEEMLFRGLILERCSRQWSILSAIVISSALFGLLHFDPLGSTTFGIFMCLVYLETRSLLVPILCHAFNNAAVMILHLSWPEDAPLLDTPEQLYSQSWFGLICLAVGLAWAGWFLVSRRDSLVPLFGDS